MNGLIPSGGRVTVRPLTCTSAKQPGRVAKKPILFYAIESVGSAGIRDIGTTHGPLAARLNS